MKKGIVR